jgi:hypothetical protein
MTADHQRYSEWDAAYVLGALSTTERLEFEDHLDSCDKCRAAVAELSGLPGLLGRLDHARAYALAEPDVMADSEETDVAHGALLVAVEPEPDPIAPDGTGDLVTRIRARERSQKLRRRLGIAAGLAAAAALASVLTIVAPQVISPPQQPLVTAQLAPVSGPSPIDGWISLTPVGWGTRLDLACDYAPGTSDPGNSAYGPVEYSLWVVGRDGSESSVSSWQAVPDSSLKLTSGTALAVADIAKVDLRTADGSLTLLTADLTQGG